MNQLLLNVLSFLLGLKIFLSCSQSNDETKHPNILFIFSDNHATYAIEADGEKQNNPNLQKFVKPPHPEVPPINGIIHHQKNIQL